MGDLLRFDAERLRILVERHQLLHRQRARTRTAGRLGRRAGELRQGDAERLPPRALRELQARSAQAAKAACRANAGVSAMGKATGFLEIERQDRGYDKPDVRRRTGREFVKPLPDRSCQNRRRAAWIAASRSATTAARSTT